MLAAWPAPWHASATGICDAFPPLQGQATGEGGCSKLPHTLHQRRNRDVYLSVDLGLGVVEGEEHAHLQRQPEGLAASASIGIVQAAPLRLQVQHLHVHALVPGHLQAGLHAVCRRRCTP